MDGHTVTELFPTAAVEFVNVTKRFGAVAANDAVSFRIPRGTVHGIIGENGAGKSTLMSALFGLYRPDDGHILLDGKQVELSRPAVAIKHGIGMVHQHFMLAERLTALQNIILGSESTFWLSGGVGNARAQVEAIQKKYGLAFPLDLPIRDLPVGVQQRVEIVKSLFRDANVLVLDEPTSVLTPQEVQSLFAVFRDLADEGKTVILITHKLHEIVEVTTNVTVLRKGQVVGTRRTAEASKSMLAEMMVGRKLLGNVTVRSPSGTNSRVAIDRLTVRDNKGTARVSDLTFDIRSSEILGIAGVSGNGQTELIACLAGQMPVAAGAVRLGELDWSREKAPTALDVRLAGVALVPEDRQRHALVGRWSASDNSVLGIHRSGKVPGIGARMKASKIVDWCRKLMQQHDVRPADPMRPASVFSGGNQQKLVIARELSTDPDVIIVGQPTRGVDVGAIEAIHASLIAERNRGKAILVISVELEEVMGLSDRVLVMFEGRSMGILDHSEFDESTIGLMMAGVPKDEAISHRAQEMQS